MEKLSASLPPGFGFHPTDSELISHYLKMKILGHKFDDLIPELDIYKYEPWDLPSKCYLPMRDNKWHFFALRDRKYPNGFRSNRATEEGYWKSTGKDRNVKSQNRVIGTKKTLVFHKGRPPSGKRTDWIMHEYYIHEKECKKAPSFMDTCVLCRVTKRNGWQVDSENVGIQNGYDASFPLDQSKEKVETVVKEPSSHSYDINDIDAWISELWDPNFCFSLCEVELEAEVDFSSPEPKLEPVDSCPDQAEDDVDFLLEDDIYNIMKSVTDNRSPVSSESNIETTNAASTSGNSYLNENVAEDDTGIKLRRRTRSPSAEASFHRIRLQVSKMESRNILSVNHIVKFCNEGHHLDLNKREGSDFSNGIAVDQESAVGKPSASSSFQSDVQSNPCSASDLPCPSASETVLGKSSASNVTLHKSSAARLKDAKCIQGIRGAIPSAGLNLLILSACVVGSAALILYFWLHDARRPLASFFPL